MKVKILLPWELTFIEKPVSTKHENKKGDTKNNKKECEKNGKNYKKVKNRQKRDH